MVEQQHTPGPWLSDEDEWLEEPDDLLTSTENARLMGRAPDLLAVAEAVTLFYGAGGWTAEERERWRQITGHEEATTKVLGDMARAVFAKATGEGKVPHVIP